MGGIQIISASAGSGKTHRLATLLEEEIREKRVRPEAVVATTFTNRAAAELQERVRTHLMRRGLVKEAQLLMGARFGTVNSVCGRLLSEFTFDLGLSPSLRVVDEEKARQVLKRSLDMVVTAGDRDRINDLARRWEHLERKFKGDRDWMDDVSEMVKLARANRIEPEALEEFARRSFEGFSQLLDTVSSDPEALERNLVSALGEFRRNVESSSDRTKATSTLVEASGRVIQALSRGEHPPWKEWLQLTLLETGKKSKEFAKAVRAPAGAHLSHPRFHEDFENITGLLPRLAANVIQGYQQFKLERGLIDFTDQEVYALSLLGNPDIQKRLKGQIELVLVDEFQDTSPLQLAIFLKLAEISDRSVWVGDQKQAIYGFRGTDPALMDAAIDEIVGGGEPETLSFSYRSRPALVRLTSELFARAFRAQGIPDKRVRLEPHLKEEPDGLGPVVERWVTKGNVKSVAARIASGVGRLIHNGPAMVRDRKSGDARPAMPCDVAVLCRTNSQCDQVSEALENMGIRAARPREGLLATHEGRLMLSGLRLWVAPKDRLALAELLRLVRHPDSPDEWLRDVLKESWWRDSDEWPEIKPLLAARKKTPLAGALTAFELALETLHARELCLSWGDASARLANLDAMREHAARYVREGASVPGGPSPAGLLVYLDQLQEDGLDAQAAVSDENAVAVSTWHSAKGLEWPIVVLYGIDTERETDPCGATVLSEKEEFDFEEPLAGRWIRYWPKPYHRKQARGELLARVAKHSEASRARERGRREDLRLLYVTWTRARDRLVLAAKQDGLTSGILGLLNREEELVSEPELPESPEIEVKTSWAGFEFNLMIRQLSPAEPQEKEMEPGEGYEASGPKAHPPAWVRPSDPGDSGRAGEPETIGDRINLRGSPDMRHVGYAVHGFMAADREDYPEEDLLEMASGLLERWRVKEALDPGELKASGTAFRKWVNNRWPGAHWHREMPLMHRLEEGSVVRGECDLALEMEDGWVVIDHKSFPGSRKDAGTKAAQYAGQLFAYAGAIQVATGKPVLGCYVHMPLLGMAVEVMDG